MAEILKVSNLKVSFDSRTVIEKLSFDLNRGDNLAIIGPNGAGKTVLLKALLGMIPYEGEIEWAPKIKLAYVPQKIDADRHLPINLKNLLRAKAAIIGASKTETAAIANEVGLPAQALLEPIGHLSGGQFQRALIAFALLGRPDALLLDEPTASIDIPGEEQIYELLHGLQDKYAITVVLVSHDLSFVYKYAAKVLCVNRTGLCFGPPEEILNQKVLEKLYGPHKYFHHYHDRDDHQ